MWEHKARLGHYNGPYIPCAQSLKTTELKLSSIKVHKVIIQKDR